MHFFFVNNLLCIDRAGSTLLIRKKNICHNYFFFCICIFFSFLLLITLYMWISKAVVVFVPSFRFFSSALFCFDFCLRGKSNFFSVQCYITVFVSHIRYFLRWFRYLLLSKFSVCESSTLMKSSISSH